MKNFFVEQILVPILTMINRIRGAYVVFVRDGPMSHNFTCYWFNSKRTKVSNCAVRFELDPETLKVHITEYILELANTQSEFGFNQFWCYKGDRFRQPIEELRRP